MTRRKVSAVTLIPRHLEEQLRDGRVIPFVGAGVSMAVARKGGGRLFPSWKQLLLDGANRLEESGKNAAVVRALVEDDPPDFLQAAQKLREKLGAALWADFLKGPFDILRAEIDDASLELARIVWRLGSRLLLTTNYDQVLRWACPDDLRDDLKTWDINAPAEQSDYLRRGEVRAPTVWHLHGRIDNASQLILTPDGYATLYPSAGEAVPRHQAALQTLRHLLASRSFLFIGFSFDDQHFGVQLESVLQTFEGFGGPHYALVHQREAGRLRNKPVEPLVFADFGERLVELLGELVRRVDPAPSREPSDVYLAAVADTQRRLRKRIHDDLVREGVSVAWDVPPPFGAAGHREEASVALERARLSVHLLDGYAGLDVDGAPAEGTYPQVQVRLARDLARPRLIWVPRELPDDEIEDTQRVLLAELRGAADSAAGQDFQVGTPPNELIADILARLCRERPLLAEPQAVLLDGHSKDAAVVEEVEHLLRDHRVPTYIHRPLGDPRRDAERLAERLRSVGALVVCHGRVEVDWVGSRIDEAFKAVFKRPCPLDLFCVYLAPPDGKDLRLYERFKLLESLDKFKLLQGPLASATFTPLFEKLGFGGAP